MFHSVINTINAVLTPMPQYTGATMLHPTLLRPNPVSAPVLVPTRGSPTNIQTLVSQMQDSQVCILAITERNVCNILMVCFK